MTTELSSAEQQTVTRFVDYVANQEVHEWLIRYLVLEQYKDVRIHGAADFISVQVRRAVSELKTPNYEANVATIIAHAPSLKLLVDAARWSVNLTSDLDLFVASEIPASHTMIRIFKEFHEGCMRENAWNHEGSGEA